MADVGLVFRWANGDELTASCEVDDSYPDSVAEARATAVRAFREAHATLVSGGDT